MRTYQAFPKLRITDQTNRRRDGNAPNEETLLLKETVKYSRVCARDRFWSSGKAQCRSGSDSTGPVSQRRQGPEPAGPSGLGRIFPECGVALLDRRITAALRPAPCLEKNADANAGVRILQRFLKETLIHRPIAWISGLGAACLLALGTSSTALAESRLDIRMDDPYANVQACAARYAVAARFMVAFSEYAVNERASMVAFASMNLQNHYGYTALALQEFGGNEDAVMELIELASPIARDSNEQGDSVAETLNKVLDRCPDVVAQLADDGLDEQINAARRDVLREMRALMDQVGQ